MIYKRFVYLIFLSCSVLIAHSQSTARQGYVETYAQIAVDEMNRSGIPASITEPVNEINLETIDEKTKTKSVQNQGRICKSK